MAGKFDGILLCSDFDGTLYVKKAISKENADAIRYFQENGGYFTIASGRYPDFLASFRDQVCANTYLIGLNGAMIASYDRKQRLYEGFLQSGSADMVWEISHTVPGLRHISIFVSETPEEIGLPEELRRKLEGYYGFDLPFADRALFDTLMACHVYKVVYRVEEEKSDDASAMMRRMAGEGYSVTRSWITGLELQNAAHTKGCSTRRLAEHLGAHTLVCVGDYENDLSMICEADIGYAVGDGALSLRNAADRILPPAADNAIAALIEDLERTVVSR